MFRRTEPAGSAEGVGRGKGADFGGGQDDVAAGGTELAEDFAGEIGIHAMFDDGKIADDIEGLRNFFEYVVAVEISGDEDDIRLETFGADIIDRGDPEARAACEIGERAARGTHIHQPPAGMETHYLPQISPGIPLEIAASSVIVGVEIVVVDFQILLGWRR